MSLADDIDGWVWESTFYFINVAKVKMGPLTEMSEKVNFWSPWHQWEAPPAASTATRLMPRIHLQCLLGMHVLLKTQEWTFIFFSPQLFSSVTFEAVGESKVRPFFLFYFGLFLEAGSYCASQAGLNLNSAFLPLPHRHVRPCPAEMIH